VCDFVKLTVIEEKPSAFCLRLAVATRVPPVAGEQGWAAQVVLSARPAFKTETKNHIYMPDTSTHSPDSILQVSIHPLAR
jgi:hypothetical protein